MEKIITKSKSEKIFGLFSLSFFIGIVLMDKLLHIPETEILTSLALLCLYNLFVYTLIGVNKYQHKE